MEIIPMLKTTAAIAAVTAVAGAANAFVLTSGIANPVNQLGEYITVQGGTVNDLFGSGLAQADTGFPEEDLADTYFGLGNTASDFIQATAVAATVPGPTDGVDFFGFSGLAVQDNIPASTSRAIDGIGADALFLGRVSTQTGTGITGDLVLTFNETEIYSLNLDGTAGRLFDTSTTTFQLPNQTGTAEDAALYSLAVTTDTASFFTRASGFVDVNTFDIYVVREIPAPGAAGLLAVAGVAAARRRRA